MEISRRALIIIILLFLLIIFYFLFRKRRGVKYPEVLKRPELKRPKLPEKVVEDFEKAKKDVEDIEKRIKPMGEPEAEAIEPFVEEFRLDISDLLRRLMKMERDKMLCEEESRKFIAKVRAGLINEYSFAKQALKLNLKHQHILKADLRTVKQVVLELNADIIKFQKKIAVYVQGGPEVRRVLLDLDDLMARFRHVEKFFVEDIEEVRIPLRP